MGVFELPHHISFFLMGGGGDAISHTLNMYMHSYNHATMSFSKATNQDTTKLQFTAKLFAIFTKNHDGLFLCITL